MEETASSIEDHLIEGLSFKLKPGASYVQSRRSVSFFPQGGNSYSSTGVKVIKISLTGAQGEWLDPTTLAVMFTINNAGNPAVTTGAPMLHFLSGPWTLFRRMRIICGGAIIEDVDNYSRCHELFHMLGSAAKRRNDAVLGFNTSTYDDLYDIANHYPLSRDWYKYVGIYDNKAVMFKPLSGLINQDKYLPLRYMGGLTLEFELVSDPTECLISDPYTFAAVTAAGIVLPEAAVTVLQVTDISTNWFITDVQIKCDVIQLDNNLNDEYVKYLLSGKALAINYNTYVSQFQTVSGQQNSINVTRSLSRLKSIFVSHLGPLEQPASIVCKYPNTFFHPMHAATTTTGYDEYTASNELEWQIQIGSRLFPEYSCRSVSESYYQLLKCVGTLDSAYMDIDISAQNYRNLKFVIGLDLEKVLQAGFTGINTKAGDLLTVKTKSLATTDNATMMHIILHADMILNISDNGVSVYD
jgi:hypothetical protein